MLCWKHREEGVRVRKERRLEVREIRGRTNEGRLRGLDEYVVGAYRALIEAGEGLAVDLGFGDEAVTTVEWTRAMRAVNEEVRVCGVEVEEWRVAAARDEAGDEVEFLLGGFELEEALGEPAMLIRAMNVLRQYRPEEVREAHRSWGRALGEGGVLLEGTSDGTGSVLSAHVFRRRNGRLWREGLLFVTDFRRGFAPVMFRDVLPRDLRHGVFEGHPAYAFFERWMRIWKEMRAEGVEGPRASFQESVRRLQGETDWVIAESWMVEAGMVLWRAENLEASLEL